MRFNKTLRKILYNLLLYNNCFLEIVKKGQITTDLNILETSYMKIDADDNGDVQGYYQEVNSNENNPRWDEEEVVHFKLDDYTTNVWTEFNVDSLYETIMIKDFIRQWLNWFFGTNQLRPVYNITGAGDKKIRDFISYLKAAEKNLNKPLILEGEISNDSLSALPDNGKAIMDVLEWCDEQILVLLQVPRIALGIGSDSGRSDSAELLKTFNVRVESIRNAVSEDITYDLFPKMGNEKVAFVWGVVDETSRTKVFENVEIMRRAQFTEEAIGEYLQSQGINFDTDKVFVSKEELMMMSNKQLGTGNEGIKGNVSADAAGSRARQNPNEIQKKNSEVVANDTYFKRFW